MASPDHTTKLRNRTDPIERLTWHYENPAAEAVSSAAGGIPVVGITSNTVPWELVRASGAFPCVINPRNSKLPDIGSFMEEGVFEERIRAIFGAAISGDLQFLSLLLIPRTSEQEYKLYLYLREVSRQDPERRLPPVYLYDMLHTRSRESCSYGLERTLCLKERLEELTGKRVDDAALLHAIRESNSARKAIRKLVDLRRHEPRISGTEALALIGASVFVGRDEYTRLADKAAEMIGNRNPLAGRKLMIVGSSLNHRGLHRALEQQGAVVVAEDDWWGSRSAGEDIADGSGDLLKAIFEKYYLDAPSPRLFPFEFADAWFQQESMDGIDGIVFYLPPEDCVAGWDYPRRRQYLDERGIPHFLVREDATSLSEECRKRIGLFVRSIGKER
ncbi:MAG: 2-hydroxyacyl-CoA dehydratase [Acidobacteria bacterium]|nr:2-hydroxyacyl-CoA dehydratase [Acidobacteriota bacterium]